MFPWVHASAWDRVVTCAAAAEDCPAVPDVCDVEGDTALHRRRPPPVNPRCEAADTMVVASVSGIPVLLRGPRRRETQRQQRPTRRRRQRTLA